MAVTFDAQSAVSTGSNVATLDLTHTIGAGSDRGFVVGLAFNGTQPAGITAVWDQGGTNQAMTAITGAAGVQNGDGSNVIMYGLVAPTSGTKTLRVSWTGNKSIYIEGVSYFGVDQTSVAVAFPNGASAQSNATVVSSITITSAVGDAVVAIHSCALDVFDSVNQIEVFRLDTAPNTNAAGNRAAGAATVNLTATISPITEDLIAAGTSVKASVAAVVAGMGLPAGDIFVPNKRFGPTRGLRPTQAFPSQEIASGVGAATGTGTATGIGAATAESVSAASGTGAAAAIGASTAASVGSAAGVGAAAAVGTVISAATGNAVGTGAATGVGNALFSGVGNATSVGVANGVGFAIVPTVQLGMVRGSIFTPGIPTKGLRQTLAFPQSISTGAAIGNAVGIGTALGIGSSTAASVGAATGTGATTGAGTGINASASSAAGIGTASAVGAEFGSGVGSSTGIGAAAAIATSTAASIASASGTGIALGVGATTGFVSGVGLATGLGEAFGIAPMAPEPQTISDSYIVGIEWQVFDRLSEPGPRYD